MITHTTITCDFCGKEIFTDHFLLTVINLSTTPPAGTEKKYDVHKECAKSVRYFIEAAEGRKKDDEK